MDPPFANVSLTQLVKCIRLMGKKEKMLVPVYIAYNSNREAELLQVFSDHLPKCPEIKRLFSLKYKSVRNEMQDKIYLYGPCVL